MEPGISSLTLIMTRVPLPQGSGALLLFTCLGMLNLL
jgi:hypothetical protein